MPENMQKTKDFLAASHAQQLLTFYLEIHDLYLQWCDISRNLVTIHAAAAGAVSAKTRFQAYDANSARRSACWAQQACVIAMQILLEMAPRRPSSSTQRPDRSYTTKTHEAKGSTKFCNSCLAQMPTSGNAEKKRLDEEGAV
eukprot:5988967-Amphidinium_carterae.1